MKIALSNQNKKGFTLIEILVVVGIIGILAGLIFTGANGVINNAKKAHAKHTGYQIQNGVSSYFTEYRKMPVPEIGSEIDGAKDFSTSEEFMDILLAADSEVGRRKNTRGVVFFTGKAARKIGPDKYVKGIASISNDGGGSLWDPYGRMYGIRMDVRSRGRLRNPQWDEPSMDGGIGAPEWGASNKDFSDQPEVLNEQIVIWSAGKDPDDADDNIKTWE